MTESTPFEHIVIPRATDFRVPGEPTIQDVYAAMTTDEARNRLIADDVARAVEQSRSPLVLSKHHINTTSQRAFTRRIVRACGKCKRNDGITGSR